MDRLNQMAKYFFLFLILIFLSSCYEPIDGCVDILSTNYQLDADSECDDCCTFPNLRIRLNYTFGEENFNRFSYYNFGGTDSLRILNSHFFMYNPYLIQDSLKIESEDSVSVLCTLNGNLENQFISNTLEKLRLSSSLVEFKNFRSMGRYDSLGFTIGLGSCLSQLEETENITTELSNFNDLTGSLNENEELVQMYFQLENQMILDSMISESRTLLSDTTITDTIFPNQMFKDSTYLDTIFANTSFQYRCILSDTTLIRDTFEIEIINQPASNFSFPTDIMNNLATDMTDTIHVDVKILLDGIQSNQSDDARKLLILENIPSVFRLH